MTTLSDIYRPSLALLTDLYQLTMAYGFWKTGMAETEAAFNLSFREAPFRGGYAVACGLEGVLDFLEGFRFDERDLAYLGELCGSDGKALFDAAFLRYLRDLRFPCSVDAVPEGTVVFPHEPLLRVEGPIVPCQIVESALLNMVNFQTLIASKAARVVRAARGDPVLEFGLRRAQGIDGALSASRAAYIGGCAATSNVLAGKLFAIPVKGTHAHSWVMCFPSEEAAFQAYAEAMPNNCVFLVDTYDTLEGVRRAIAIGTWLRERGQELLGIRLDSGDLAYLSIEARTMLDQAGFPKAVIVASNDLDEHLIESLKDQGATIAVWGVGTKLATGAGQSALGGVYKLAAVRGSDGAWQYKLKLSEQTGKINVPGRVGVRRYQDRGAYLGDCIYDAARGVPEACVIVDPMDPTRRKRIPPEASSTELLVKVMDRGARTAAGAAVPIEELRRRTQTGLEGFHAGVKRLANPHVYPVGLEQGLSEIRTRLILEARGFKQ